MALDPHIYRIEVLHYLNPHLLWVTIVNLEKPREFIFEQIGIYGVLPQEISIELESEGLSTKECKNWCQAATRVMSKCFTDAAEIWFSPTFIDRRSSIFDDNIHKYGDITVIKKNGKKRMLTSQLVKSGFALYDSCLFHQKLSQGELKTKLDHTQIRQVIKQLEKSDSKKPKDQWEKSVKKQTNIYNAACNLESSLTIANLERHNLGRDVNEVLERKLKDLEQCKGIDEVSIGRATSRETNHEESKSLNKTEHDKTVSRHIPKSKHGTQDVLQATKNFLGLHASFKGEVTHKTEDEEWNLNRQHTVTPPDTSKKTRIRRTELQKRVVYGPPNIDFSKLSGEVVPSKQEDNKLTRDTNSNFEGIEVTKQNFDMFAGVDSEVGIEITNKDSLQKQKQLSEKATHTKESNNCIDETPAIIRKMLALHKDKVKESAETSKINTKKITENINKSIKELNDRDTQSNQEKRNILPNKDNGDIVNRSTDSTLSDSSCEPLSLVRSKLLQRKLQAHRETMASASGNSSSDIAKDSSTSEDKKNRTLDSDDDSNSDLLEKINLEYPKNVSPKKDFDSQKTNLVDIDSKNNVNPFKNVDAVAGFVDKLVTPVLMVHTKMNKRIQPCFDMRDIPFNTHIHVTLKNMNIARPMMIQSVSWYTILRGYSLFMVSPLKSGKTIGYLPAVCRHISDSKSDSQNGVGPLAIIVCGTANTVVEVEKLSKMFLGLEERVVTGYTGMDDVHLTSSLLNGCDLLICTPPMLVRLLQANDFGVDLRRLTTVVLEDCERLSEVYMNEVKLFLIKITEMLKIRTNKELPVQYIAVSRIWCDFMHTLAKRAPNSVICIGAFQECVLYSEANTSVKFVKNDNKVNTVLGFLNEIDRSKRTVIVCRSDDEVGILKKVLNRNQNAVFACDNAMTIHDLYNLNKTWAEYQEPVLGPILICCDGNLTHLNVTNAHYLVHFSLPHLFSMFCKRFAVLNDNYPSIFKTENESVKIKILLEDNNLDQLPKIMHFIKRCTDNIPESLDAVCDTILAQKDAAKAKKMIPICDSLLALGECPDFWNCVERHAAFKEYDEPKQWIPKTGVVTFKILHYQTATLYSARLLSNVVDGNVTKYNHAYSALTLKLGMYFSKESNRKLHGIPQVGDICAVSVRRSFFVRCQVMKILSHYQTGKPNQVLIKLIDEEILEISSDVYLYYLPDELKSVDTYVVQVRLANIKPKDKDVMFSELAKDQLKKITDKKDLYMRGQVRLTLANCLFVDTLEACQTLTSVHETVVIEDYKKLLMDTHAVPNPDHMPKLEKLCHEGELDVTVETNVVAHKQVNTQTTPDWAHLEDDMTLVVLVYAKSPSTFFVRVHKFAFCRKLLTKDIEKYIADKPEPVTQITKGDIVLARNPDDGTYDRARIEEIFDDGKVKCFCVDEGDTIYVDIKDLVPIPDKFITQLPFQAIECRLIGVQPLGQNWTEFATNWFINTCERDENGDCKQFYLKYFTKETADYTDWYKYSVALIDTSKKYDVLINRFMLDANLAVKNDEAKYFEQLQLVTGPPAAGEPDEAEFLDDELTDEDKIDSEVLQVHRNKDMDKVAKDNYILDKNLRDQINQEIEEICEMGSANKDLVDSRETIKDNITQSSKNNMLSEQLEEIRSSPEVENIDEEVGPKIPLKMIFPKTELKPRRENYEFEVSNDDDSSDFEFVMGDNVKDYLRNALFADNVNFTPKNHKNAEKTQEVIAIKKSEEAVVVTSKHNKYTRENLFQNKKTSEGLDSYDMSSESIDKIQATDNIVTEILPNTQDILSIDSDIVSNTDDSNEVLSQQDKICKKLQDFEVLDSDDLSECSQNSEHVSDIVRIDSVTNEPSQQSYISKAPKFDSDNKIDLNNFSSKRKQLTNSKNIQNLLEVCEKRECIAETKESASDLRRPQLLWRQNKTSVIIKIKLIGVETYKLIIGDRSLKFETSFHDILYGFHFDLYGVVDCNKSTHENKGQYILVNLKKVLKRTWVTLTRGVNATKWITYDVDFIDTSSDEEPVVKYPLGKATRHNHSDSDSDIDIIDDCGF